MKTNYMISLDNVDIQMGNLGGGKFMGLVKLKQLLQRYNAKYKTNFIIPRTYVIPITEFAEYEHTKTANENAVVKYRYVLQSIIQYTDK